MDREEVRRCAEMVAWGECIEFPNGLVIDKRPLPASQPYQYATHPGYPVPMPASMYRCSSCGAWVVLGQQHSCITVGQPNVGVSEVQSDSGSS